MDVDLGDLGRDCEDTRLARSRGVFHFAGCSVVGHSIVAWKGSACTDGQGGVESVEVSVWVGRRGA